MLTTLLLVLAVAVIVTVFYWAVDKLGIPQPINNILKVIFVLVGVIWLAFRFVPGIF